MRWSSSRFSDGMYRYDERLSESSIMRTFTADASEGAKGDCWGACAGCSSMAAPASFALHDSRAAREAEAGPPNMLWMASSSRPDGERLNDFL